jgi:hypothetical protein
MKQPGIDLLHGYSVMPRGLAERRHQVKLEGGFSGRLLMASEVESRFYEVATAVRTHSRSSEARFSIATHDTSAFTEATYNVDEVLTQS